MTASMVPNAGDEYVGHRQEVSAEDVIARARAKIAPQEAPKPQESTRKELVINMGRGFRWRDVPAGEGDNPSLVDTAKAIGKDVAKGMVEGPRQAVGGVSDAVHNTMMGLSNLGDWINDNIADLRVQVPMTGIEEIDKLLSNPLKAAAGDKNEVDAPESNTGALIRETSRFLTGFIPLFKAGQAMGAGKVASGIVAGGADAATRDPQEQNLVDLLKAFPALQNPVSDYLQSNPDDPEAVARFKKGLEGVGLGAMADGVILGVKAINSARRARVPLSRAAEELEAQKAQFGEMADRDFLALGDPSGPRVVRRDPVVEQPNQAKVKLGKADAATAPGVPDDVAAKGLTRAGEAGGKEVYINFGRINGPDDVKRTIGQMADAFKADIDEARRGVQSNEETAKLADQIGLSVEDLLNRRKGQPYNAEQSVAARKLWNASATKLTELAKKAADPNAGAIDQFNFRRMMALHYAIQAEVIGARTETARALQSWSIPVGGGVEKAKAVQMMLDQMGGPSFSKAMAQRLAILSSENPQAVNQFVSKTWATSSIEAMQEAWVNALLSSPKTHLVNMTSNAMVAFQQIMERGTAERISALRGGDIAPGEQMAMAYGLLSSLKDAFRAFAKTVRSGENASLPGKVDMPTREPAIHGDWLRESGYNGVAAAVNFIGHTARVPSRLLGAEDAFFKTIGYRMELHAQALRQGFAEGFRDDALAKRMMEIVNNPPEYMRLNAADAALYNTFSNATGEIGKAMMQLRDKVPGAFFIMPFVKTPVNIARYSFERSPIAPLVGQWRADIAAGGARADLALARMSTGTAIMLVAADLADHGLMDKFIKVTGAGPDDPGEKENWLRQGKKPFSIKVGDQYISYDRLDPIGMTMGFAASIVELTKRFDIEPEELDEVNEVIAAGVTAIANTVINKTYMRGVSQFFEAITEGKTNPEAVQNWMRQFTASFVPAVASTVEQIVDPVQRETFKIFDAAQAKLVGLSERLTPKRDLWGEPIKADNPIYDAISPIQASKFKVSPIDAEMERLDTNIQRISKRVNWDGVDVNLRDWPEVYDAYTRLAGNELKHPAWNLGAKDLLDQIVTGKHDLSAVYEMLPDTRRPIDGGKAAFIAKTISDFRALARREIVDDPKFAAFARTIEQGKADKLQKKMPEVGGLERKPFTAALGIRG